jgi:hypothetical protein
MMSAVQNAVFFGTNPDVLLIAISATRDLKDSELAGMIGFVQISRFMKGE